MKLNAVTVKPSVVWNIEKGTSTARSVSNGSFQPTPLTFKTDVFAGGVFADNIFAYEFSIAASGTLTYDFVGGSTTGFFGETVNFARLKGIGIEHYIDSLASSIKFGGGSNPGFGANFITPSLHKGASFLMATPDTTGWVPTAGTADVYTITNNDATYAATGVVFFLGVTV